MDEVGTIKDLIRAFNQTSFTQYTVASDGFRIHLRQRPKGSRGGPGHDGGTGKAGPDSRGSKGVEDFSKVLRSPRVGHFFLARDGQGEISVKDADLIEEGQPIGQVESMNLKYEVRAEKPGVVDRVLIEDGEAVEFGQELILLK